MSTQSIQPPEVVHFARGPGDEPAELVLHGLAGVCDALDELTTSLGPNGGHSDSERIACLAVAARILARSLTHRMGAAVVPRERPAEIRAVATA
jgi:hypothetical protein